MEDRRDMEGNGRGMNGVGGVVFLGMGLVWWVGG